jgi:hypothetical protein
MDALPPPPRRPPDVEDDFLAGPDPALWIPHYLPHWTTPDRSAARLRATGRGLELRIEEDQLDWRPEDAPLRVSNLQTGSFSGPVGSARGTHRHRDDGLVVRSPVSSSLWAPSAGRVEVTVTPSRDPGCMLAVWLVGAESGDERDSGEICVFEIDADAVGEHETAVRSGIKAHRDPRLTTDMATSTVAARAGAPHTWTVIWGAGETLIGCEGRVVRRLPQAPDYPLFLMVDLFEIGLPGGRYPKTARIHRLRGWSA